VAWSPHSGKKRRLLQQYSPEEREKLTQLYEELCETYPKSLACHRMPLDFLVSFMVKRCQFLVLLCWLGVKSPPVWCSVAALLLSLLLLLLLLLLASSSAATRCSSALWSIVKQQQDLGLPHSDLGLPHSDLGLPHSDLGLPHSDLGLPRSFANRPYQPI
jgi:hypothetical protein